MRRVGSTVGTIQYDGSNRRIVKTVTNSGDWNNVYHYYYDNWSKVEERDGSDDVLKQHVWGTQYIDELVQTALNDDPGDVNEGACETKYWGLQDANFNLLAVVGSDGSFAERYEYTPYGQRTVFKEASAGDDPLLTAPILESQRWKVSSIDQPYGICDVGHQGLFFDKEWKWYDNRTRPYGPVLARFPVRDGAYRAGMDLFEYLSGSPVVMVDPAGEDPVVSPSSPSGFRHTAGSVRGGKHVGGQFMSRTEVGQRIPKGVGDVGTEVLSAADLAMGGVQQAYEAWVDYVAAKARAALRKLASCRAVQIADAAGFDSQEVVDYGVNDDDLPTPEKLRITLEWIAVPASPQKAQETGFCCYYFVWHNEPAKETVGNTVRYFWQKVIDLSPYECSADCRSLNSANQCVRTGG